MKFYMNSLAVLMEPFIKIQSDEKNRFATTITNTLNLFGPVVANSFDMGGDQ